MHNFNCGLAIHFAGELHLGYLVPHNDSGRVALCSARVALRSASDGVGVAERALVLLHDGATVAIRNIEDEVTPSDLGTAHPII